jgi:hypothetical protein
LIVLLIRGPTAGIRHRARLLTTAERAAQGLLGIRWHAAIAALGPVGRPARVLTKLRRHPVPTSEPAALGLRTLD